MLAFWSVEDCFTGERLAYRDTKNLSVKLYFKLLYITRPPLYQFFFFYKIFIEIAGKVSCLCCCAPPLTNISASVLTTLETQPLKRSGSDESSTECSHFVWLNLLWQASMLCFGTTCCSGNLETSQFLKNSAAREAIRGLVIWGGVFSKSSPEVTFFSPLRSAQHIWIVFAYLWEMGVTVIKLTGSQFCGVWIMKSYKIWKSKDVFLKISLNFIQTWSSLMNYWSLV